MGELSMGRTKRSRRELLAGAAGVAGVVAAQTVLGAKAAYAGTDGDVVLGVDNQSTANTTGVQSSAITGLHGRSTAAGGTGVFGEDTVGSSSIGVHGTGGGYGVKGDGPQAGVYGVSTLNFGVHGSSSTNSGVYGETTDSGAAGVWGDNFGGGVGVRGHAEQTAAGVYGENTGGSGPGVLGGSPSGTAGDGVEGQTPSASSSGVYGHNDSTDAGGKGVFGASPNGIAVEGLGGQVGIHGISAGDTGVKGEGVGIGVRAVSILANNAGVGLRVDGRSVFRTAGAATVPSGQNKVTVSLAGVSATDMVLATVQQSGGFFVKFAKAASGSFTIYINKAPASPATVKVAWFVISAS